MKRFLSILITICMVLIVASSFAEGITWHNVFGLQKNEDPEIMEKTIIRVFAAEQSSYSKSTFYPSNKYFYGFPIRWIEENTYGDPAEILELQIVLEDECLTAKNLISLYQQICAEYGEPTVCDLTREMITVNGKENVPLSIDDLETIQLSMDQLSFNSLICWDNVSIEAFSRISVIDGKEWKSFVFAAAFTEYSLQSKVRELYGIGN